MTRGEAGEEKVTRWAARAGRERRGSGLGWLGPGLETGLAQRERWAEPERGGEVQIKLARGFKREEKNSKPRI